MAEVTNTSKQDPMLHLLTAMAPDGILGQEAQGQREIVNSTVLPVDMGWQREGEPPPQGQFEALGFTFGDVVDGDPLFRHATLPDGWRREGTEHSMWTGILDERGIPRVAVFYKAAFYDRKAHMSLVNVGSRIVTEFVYGDAAEPDVPECLTDEERAQVRSAAERYVADAEEFPDIYGDRLPRAWQVFHAAS